MLSVGIGVGISHRLAALGGAVLAVEDQSASFGALTLEGAGGFTPVSTGPAITSASIDSGDASGHFQISSSGEITPTATGAGSLSGPYTLGLSFNSGAETATITVSTVANKYSCKPDTTELEAAWDDATAATALGILVRDGDAQSSARWAPSPAKAFTNPFVIEPDDWTEDADPRLSTRNCLLPGITIPATTENVTVQGFDLYDDLTGGESEAFDGVVKVLAPTVNITIRQNRIHSRSMEEIYDAGDFSDNLSTMNQSRGVALDKGGSTSKHTRVRIDDNYIHDVARGVVAFDAAEDGSSVHSRVKSNYILHTYSNHITFGNFCDGLSIIDNRCQHVWADTNDTAGAIPATSPHSATGPSGDAPSPSGVCNDIVIMGNILDTGWARTVYAEANSDPAPTLAATGCKLNDPFQTDAYQSIKIAHNLILAHGITIQVIGGDGVEIYNNSLVYEPNSGLTGTPTLSLQGVANGQMRNNLSGAYAIGAQDGGTDDGVAMVTTLDTLSAYGDLSIQNGASDDFGPDAYLVGDATKGFTRLTIDEIEAAYTPKPGAWALNAAEKKGALGTGYYSGGGVSGDTAPAHSKPAATGGTPFSPTLTVWDGTVHFLRSGKMQDGGADMADGKVFTLAWEGAFHADTDGVNTYLFASQFGNFHFWKQTNNEFRCILKSASGTIYDFSTEQTYTSADGTIRLVLSVDLEKGRLQLAVNGQPIDFPLATGGTMADADVDIDGASTWRIGSDATGANRFKGDWGQLLFMNETFDLDVVSNLNKFFASTGAFVDWGSDGSNVNATTAAVVFRGNAATLNGGTGNGGDGGAFAASGGTVTDSFTPTWMQFDGSAWLERGGELTNAPATSQSMLGCITYKPEGADMGVGVYLISTATSTNTALRIQKASTDTIRVQIEDNSNILTWDASHGTALTSGTKYLILWDLDGASAGLSVRVFNVDTGAELGSEANDADTGTFAPVSQTDWIIAAINGSGTFAIAGEMERVMLWLAERTDVSQSSVVADFLDTATPALVDPATAVSAYGTPDINIAGTALSSGTNSGDGGDFVKDGAGSITAA